MIDLSKSGHSTNDIPNVVVILREGKIEAAGPADLIKIPRNTRTLDYAGSYILVCFGGWFPAASSCASFAGTTLGTKPCRTPSKTAIQDARKCLDNQLHNVYGFNSGLQVRVLPGSPLSSPINTGFLKGRENRRKLLAGCPCYRFATSGLAGLRPATAPDVLP